MSQKNNFKGKKIPKYLLDDDLVKEIENKPDSDDVWKKTAPIPMDALDANVRMKLNNISAPGASAYDDTELRTRIISLEGNRVNKADIFNKAIDKVSEALLDAGLLEWVNTVRQNIRSISEKADKSYADDAFRRKDRSIYQSDLDKGLSDKINDLVAAVNNISVQNGLSTTINSDIEKIQKELAVLSATAVTSDALKNYRQKTEPIGIGDLEALAEKAVRGAVSLSDEVNKKLNATDADAIYRKKSEPIRISDMDTGLQNTINKVSLAVESNEAAVTQIFNDRLFDDVKGWARDYFGTLMYSSEDRLGHVYPYQFAHSVCNFAGNLGTGTVNAGKLTFCSITNYLYDRANSADNSISSVNTSLLSLKNVEIKALQEKAGGLEKEIGDLKRRLTAAETLASKLEDRIEALEKEKKDAAPKI